MKKHNSPVKILRAIVRKLYYNQHKKGSYFDNCNGGGD